MWELGERVLREAMDSLGLPYVAAPGEAAFYGPKLDIQLADVMGHEETYSTIQVDFHLPNQFGLELHRVRWQRASAGDDASRHCKHHGAMVSYLIELYAGAFPVWLAPVQAIVLPITDRQSEYARSVEKQLEAAGIRVDGGRPQREGQPENPRSAVAEDPVHAGGGRPRGAERTGSGAPSEAWRSGG